MRPEPPEDLKRKPRGRSWEMGVFEVVEGCIFLGGCWGRNLYHFGGSFWGRNLMKFVPKICNAADFEAKGSKVLNLHRLWAPRLIPCSTPGSTCRGHHLVTLVGWFFVVGGDGCVCCVGRFPRLCQVEIPEIEFSIRPKAERRVDTIYNLILGCKMMQGRKHWNARNGCYQFRLKILKVYLNLIFLVNVLCSLLSTLVNLAFARLDWGCVCASEISSSRHTKDSFGGLPFGRSCSKESAHGRIPERGGHEQDMWDHWTTQHPVSWCKYPCQMGEVPFEVTCCFACWPLLIWFGRIHARSCWSIKLTSSFSFSTLIHLELVLFPRLVFQGWTWNSPSQWR